ncbi:MAG: 4a-hydroxytetrahydrobiopterin dehydratase [Deltaproteobacteria bacterium]|nr:4a-hydroxytetrahydrobiopterin dehydratase [Deltaproteobacteria bacterium]
MAITKLAPDEINKRLSKLPEWSLDRGKLHRSYQFSNFIEAFGFMASCALVAEKLDHHPEWSNVYNRVVVDLTTHDAGGISAKDFELAEGMDRLAARAR